MVKPKKKRKTATKIRDITGWTGRAALYKVEPPLKRNDHVIVSATVVMFSGPETYIFGATADGQVESWDELDGSFRGGLNHVTALNRAGYEVVGSETGLAITDEEEER